MAEFDPNKVLNDVEAPRNQNSAFLSAVADQQIKLNTDTLIQQAEEANKTLDHISGDTDTLVQDAADIAGNITSGDQLIADAINNIGFDGTLQATHDVNGKHIISVRFSDQPGNAVGVSPMDGGVYGSGDGSGSGGDFVGIYTKATPTVTFSGNGTEINPLTATATVSIDTSGFMTKPVYDPEGKAANAFKTDNFSGDNLSMTGIQITNSYAGVTVGGLIFKNQFAGAGVTLERAAIYSDYTGLHINISDGTKPAMTVKDGYDVHSYLGAAAVGSGRAVQWNTASYLLSTLGGQSISSASDGGLYLSLSAYQTKAASDSAYQPKGDYVSPSDLTPIENDVKANAAAIAKNSTAFLHNDLSRSDGADFDEPNGYVPTLQNGQLVLAAPQGGESAVDQTARDAAAAAQKTANGAATDASNALGTANAAQKTADSALQTVTTGNTATVSFSGAGTSASPLTATATVNIPPQTGRGRNVISCYATGTQDKAGNWIYKTAAGDMTAADIAAAETVIFHNGGYMAFSGSQSLSITIDGVPASSDWMAGGKISFTSDGSSQGDWMMYKAYYLQNGIPFFQWIMKPFAETPILSNNIRFDGSGQTFSSDISQQNFWQWAGQENALQPSMIYGFPTDLTTPLTTKSGSYILVNFTDYAALANWNLWTAYNNSCSILTYGTVQAIFNDTNAAGQQRFFLTLQFKGGELNDFLTGQNVQGNGICGWAKLYATVSTVPADFLSAEGNITPSPLPSSMTLNGYSVPQSEVAHIYDKSEIMIGTFDGNTNILSSNVPICEVSTTNASSGSTSLTFMSSSSSDIMMKSGTWTAIGMHPFVFLYGAFYCEGEITLRDNANARQSFSRTGIFRFS